MLIARKDLAKLISDECGFSSEDVYKTLLSFMRVVRAQLEKGNTVQLKGFGTFYVYRRKDQMCRNPNKPKVLVFVPAHNVPIFSATEAFSEQIKNSSTIENKGQI